MSVKKDIITILSKIKNKQATRTDAFLLCKLLYTKNFVFSFPHKAKLKTYRLQPTTIHGIYKINTNTIMINQQCIDDVLCGKEEVAELFITLGHEIAHEYQYMQKRRYCSHPRLYRLITSASEKELKQLHTFFTLRFSNANIQTLLALLYAEQMQKLSNKECKQVADTVEHFQYLKLKEEEDAREESLYFACQMMQSIGKLPYIDESMRTYIQQQLRYIEKVKQREKENITQYKYLERFERDLFNERFSVLKTLEETYYKDVKVYVEQESFVRDVKLETQYSLYVKVMNFIMRRVSFEYIATFFQQANVYKHWLAERAILDNIANDWVSLTKEQKKRLYTMYYESVLQTMPPKHLYCMDLTIIPVEYQEKMMRQFLERKQWEHIIAYYNIMQNKKTMFTTSVHFEQTITFRRICQSMMHFIEHDVLYTVEKEIKTHISNGTQDAEEMVSLQKLLNEIQFSIRKQHKMSDCVGFRPNLKQRYIMPSYENYLHYLQELLKKAVTTDAKEDMLSIHNVACGHNNLK